MNPIYLDNNATTPIDPEVAEAVRKAQLDLRGNPASQHWAGQQARKVLQDARDEIAQSLGARTGITADRIVFTSGGTESNNLALRGMGSQPLGQVIVSPVEHPSVLVCAAVMAKEGCEVQQLDVDSDGVVRCDHLRELISPSTRLVSVMVANHETGVLQPINEVAEICAGADVPFHTDAVQAVGKIRVHFAELAASAMSVSGHKFHGPTGIGVLLIRSGLPLNPLLLGGAQQLGFRAGTEPVPLAVGMAQALKIWQRQADERERELRASRDRLEHALMTREPRLRINGLGAKRAPHTSNISFPGVDRQEMALALDMAGIACATGSACASGASDPSPVLRATGTDEHLISSALRFSVSHCTTAAEIDEASQRIIFAYQHLQRPSESRKRGDAPRNRLGDAI